MASHQDSTKSSNFWFCFSQGIAATAMLIYLFGTSNGRQTLKNLLDLSENFEENLNSLIEEFTTETKSDKHEISTLGSILNKMKIFSPLLEKKQVKKFFLKEDKLIEQKVKS